MYVPRRGDFIWLRFDPQSGHEQKGNRPALVLSPKSFNQKIGFAFVCPVSNTQRKSPFYVAIPKGQAITGVIMADQLRSLDYKARRAEYAAECSETVVQDVLKRIKPILFSS